MEGRNTASDSADAVFRCLLLALVLAAATNTVVAAIDAAMWAWWAAGAFALVALLLAGAWSGPGGERTARSGYGQTQQVQLVVGEVGPAALVRRDRKCEPTVSDLLPSAGDASARSTAVKITPGAIAGCGLDRFGTRVRMIAVASPMNTAARACCSGLSWTSVGGWTSATVVSGTGAETVTPPPPYGGWR